jgi:hypothetical protein
MALASYTSLTVKEAILGLLNLENGLWATANKHHLAVVADGTVA